MDWLDSLHQKWGRHPRTRRRPDRREFRPKMEPLEAREMPAVNFIQGFAFVDLNGNGVRDAGDAPKPNVTVELHAQGGALLTSTQTGPDGYYRFDNLAPGTYQVKEDTPPAFAANGVQVKTMVSTAAQAAADTATVTVRADADPAINPLTVQRLNFPNAAGNVPGVNTAFTLAGGALNADTSVPRDSNARQFEANLLGGSGNTVLAGDFYSFCVDLFHLSPGTFTVTADAEPFIPASVPGASGLPTAANLGAIGYLYNTYGTTLRTTGADQAGLQLAIWELEYDAVPDLNSGNFRIATGTDSGAIAAANQYLADAAGHDQAAVYFNVTSDGGGRQSMIGTEQVNFVNLPHSPPPPPGPGSVAGTVYADCVMDGKFGPGDMGLGGVTLTLTGGGQTVTTTTNPDGSYSFGSLPAATYTLTESQPAGFDQGMNTIGSLGGTETTHDTIAGIVVSGTAGTGYNFGEDLSPSAAKISLVKTPDKTTVQPGEMVTYTYVVTNNSPLPATNVTVRDDNATPGDPTDDFTVGTVASLAPGASQTFTATRSLPIPMFDTINGTSVRVGTLMTEVLPDGNYRITYTQSRDLNDNVYGTSATAAAGWAKGHKFSDLVGSDHAEFRLSDTGGTAVMDFSVDYVSQASGAAFPGGTVSYPSGYGTLGVLGGDGKMILGSSSNVLSAWTSISQDVNHPPAGYTFAQVETNSPPEPTAGWIYDNVYQVVVSKAAFGAGGLGGVQVVEVHNSPSKTGFDMSQPKPGSADVTNVATADATVCGIPAQATATATVHVGMTTGPCPPVHSAITSNFNGTDIPAGTTIWVNSVVDVSGLDKTKPTTVTFTNAKLTYTDTSSGKAVTTTLDVPAAKITFDPAATKATTTYDAAAGQWLTVVPVSLGGNGFLTALPVPVTQTIKGGAVKTITLSGDFATDSATDLTLKWQWAAAVYDTRGPNAGLFADLNAVGVKPVDDGKASAYQNSDHAGTPEAAKKYVLGGARGGGGSNFTGSYSGTASASLVCMTMTSGMVTMPSSGPGGMAQTAAFDLPGPAGDAVTMTATTTTTLQPTTRALLGYAA